MEIWLGLFGYNTTLLKIYIVAAKNKKKEKVAESSDEEDHDDSKSVVSNTSSNAVKPAAKSKSKKGESTFLASVCLFIKGTNALASYMYVLRHNKVIDQNTCIWSTWFVL